MAFRQSNLLLVWLQQLCFFRKQFQKLLVRPRKLRLEIIPKGCQLGFQFWWWVRFTPSFQVEDTVTWAPPSDQHRNDRAKKSTPTRSNSIYSDIEKNYGQENTAL